MKWGINYESFTRLFFFDGFIKVEVEEIYVKFEISLPDKERINDKNAAGDLLKKFFDAKISEIARNYAR